MHPAVKEDIADLLVLMLCSITGLGILFLIFLIIFDTTPSSHYVVNSTTKISVSFEDCVAFGRESRREDSRPLAYEQNGVEMSLSQRAAQLSDQPVVKTCVAALIQKAQKSLRFEKPVTADDNFLKSGIHPQFELFYKNKTPFITSHFLNGVKVNSITFPVEACVNPQFEGPVSMAYQEKTYKETSVNTAEQEIHDYFLLKATCQELSRLRDL